MDPISALNIAAAAIQFVDFGLKTLKLCREIRDSKDGVIEAHALLQKENAAVKRRKKELQIALQSSKASRKILRLSRECCDAADELQVVLQRVKDASQEKNFRVLKAAFRLLREKKTIEALENKLAAKKDSLDKAVNIENLLLLVEQEKNISDLSAQAQIYFSDLKKLSSDQHKEQLQRHDHVERAIKTTASSLEHTIELGNASVKDAVLQRLDSEKGKQQSQDSVKSLLRHLFFPEIEARREEIKHPSPETFEWIFKDDDGQPVKTGFRKWLTSEDSLYWISGKAGSGKSTLMAHIIQDKRIRNFIKDWNHGSDQGLHILTYFFWRAGTPLQRSVQGLLRTLLYQICKAVPLGAEAVIAELELAEGNKPTWTEKRLRRSIEVALHASDAQSCRFCFFVDGLDEFEGDQDELLDLVIHIQGSFSNVKFCVSSRPESILQHRLSTYARLRVQDLNRTDIKLFVRKEFDKLPNGAGHPLATTIVDRSDGVFLWAALVTRSVIRGIQAGDDDTTLQHRLAVLPNALDALFAQMLGEVEPVYKASLAFFIHLWVISHEQSDHDHLDSSASVAIMTVASTDDNIQTYASFARKCAEVAQKIEWQGQGLIETKWRPQSNFEVDDISKASHFWFIPESNLRDIIRTDFSGPMNLMRMHGAANDSIRKVSLAHFTQLTWIHRSAFDFFSNTDAGCKFMSLSNLSDKAMEKILCRARLQIFLTFPSPYVESSETAGTRFFYIEQRSIFNQINSVYKSGDIEATSMLLKSAYQIRCCYGQWEVYNLNPKEFLGVEMFEKFNDHPAHPFFWFDCGQNIYSSLLRRELDLMTLHISDQSIRNVIHSMVFRDQLEFLAISVDPIASLEIANSCLSALRDTYSDQNSRLSEMAFYRAEPAEAAKKYGRWMIANFWVSSSTRLSIGKEHRFTPENLTIIELVMSSWNLFYRNVYGSGPDDSDGHVLQSAITTNEEFEARFVSEMATVFTQITDLLTNILAYTCVGRGRRFCLQVNAAAVVPMALNPHRYNSLSYDVLQLGMQPPVLSFHLLFLKDQLAKGFLSDCQETVVNSIQHDLTAVFRLSTAISRRVLSQMRLGDSELFRVGSQARKPISCFYRTHVDAREAGTVKHPDYMERKGLSTSKVRGTRADFEICRDEIIRELWRNEGNQLDAWQQIYAVACIKVYFRDIWLLDDGIDYPDLPVDDAVSA